MAKDPAVNWYFDNWSGGTKGFSRHQKGCYMDLLEAQFYLGPLSLDQIKNILGPDFNQWAPVLNKKFMYDENDKVFFNERLESEKEKRRRNSLKQSERVNKRWNNRGIDSGNTVVLPNNGTGIETETVIDSGKEKGAGKGKQKIDPEMEIPANVLEAAEQNQWTFTKARNTEFIRGIWKTFLLERVNDQPAKRLPYERNASELYQYFLNWSRNKFPKTNGANNSNSSTNGKAGRSEINDRARSSY